MAKPLERSTDYESQELKSIRLRFQYLASGTNIHEIGWKAVPKAAMDVFENRNRRFIDPVRYHRRDLHAIFKVSYANHSLLTYIGWHTRMYSDSYGFETLFYSCDVSTEKKLIGDAEVRCLPFDEASFLRMRPLVAWNGTEEEFQKQGYGLRRLIILNAICQTLLRLPLHASGHYIKSSPSDPENLWRKLVSMGLAFPYKQSKQNRYQFNTELETYRKMGQI
jgi:hypothetical protein